MTERDKVTVDDIIGIVHTDETTNSVEEVKKLRGRTNERFIVDTAGTLIDMETRNTYDYVSDVVDLLNELDEKYVDEFALRETLQQELQRVEEENKQLKQQLNYIQNSISEHIKHQKTELGQKALQEIIQDYNEWLLGHKELQE